MLKLPFTIKKAYLKGFFLKSSLLGFLCANVGQQKADSQMMRLKLHPFHLAFAGA